MEAAERHRGVTAALAERPVIGVVRTDSSDAAGQQARAFIAGGLALIEVTFSVPRAEALTRDLLAERAGDGPPWIGMGTVTNGDRARAAVAAGAEFIVSPNTSPVVAEVAKGAGLYLVLGALTATEIVTASELGADLVKVYPLAPVGGPRYLSTVRQPLADIPMLAGGGYDIEEIPAYAAAGAIAFGIGPPLVGSSDAETASRVRRALTLASS